MKRCSIGSTKLRDQHVFFVVIYTAKSTMAVLKNVSNCYALYSHYNIHYNRTITFKCTEVIRQKFLKMWETQKTEELVMH